MKTILLLILVIITSLPLHAGTVTGNVYTSGGQPIANGTFSFTLTQQAVKTDGTGTVATSPTACYTAGDGSVVGVPDPLVAPIVSSTGAGSIPAGTYYVRLQYVTLAATSTILSPEATVTLSGTGSIVVTAPKVQPTGATLYDVYIASTSQATSGVTVATSPSISGNTTVNALSPVTISTPINTTTCTLLFNDTLTPSYTAYSVNLVNKAGSQVSGWPQTAYLAGTTVNVASLPPYGNLAARFPTAIIAQPNAQATQSINGKLSVAGLTTRTVNEVRFADQFSGADWCAKVTAADTDLGSAPGEIWVNQDAIPGACATVPTLSANHTLRFTQAGNYVLSGTFSLPVGTKLLSDVGGVPAQSWTFGTACSGVCLKYTGGVASTPVVRVAGNDVGISGVNVDCQNTASSIGIIYNSTTVGFSYLNINRVATYSCNKGLVVGDPSTTITDCVASPNSIGCHEADTITSNYFTCYGVNGNLTDECEHINSANGAQNSVFRNSFSLGMNIHTHVVRTNGGIEIRNQIAGTPQGVNPTQVQLDANVSHPIGLYNNECEGSWTYFIHDSSGTASSGTTPTSVWELNQAGTCPVLIDGAINASNITSTSNSGATSSWTVGGQGFVQSFNDKRIWVSSGNGKLDSRYTGNDILTGTLGVGIDAGPQAGILVGSTNLTTTNQKAFQAFPTFSSAATASGNSFLSQPKTAVAAFNVTKVVHYGAVDLSLGSGSSATTQTVFECPATLAAASNNNCFNNLGSGAVTLGSGTTSLSGNLTQSGATSIATGTNGLTINGPFTSTGKITSYNGVGTVSNGVPQLVAKVDVTGQTANIGTPTLLYAVPASGAGFYRVSCYVVETVVGTTSSLPICQPQWTDNDTNTAQAQNITSTSAANAVGTNSAAAAGGSANPGITIVNVKASTNINFVTTGYASTGTAMQYTAHFKIEYLGN